MQLYNEDCRERLKQLSDNSIDSIVTDPPYELGFCNKKWDATGIAYDTELWKEMLRVLKPGGYLLCFSATRTYHRVATAIENAGFTIRDMISYIYGSGMPHGQNVSKMIDKKAGATREVVATVKKLQSYGFEGNHCYGGSPDKNGIMEITAPATDLAKQWDGWYSQLKPAAEPIVVAQKPFLEKTIVDNIIKWQTGAFNIDACRIAHNEPVKTTQRHGRDNASVMNSNTCGFDNTKKHIASADPKGRYPANLILDEQSSSMLDKQSGISKSAKSKTIKPAYDGNSNTKLMRGISSPDNQYDDVGGASRFFYCVKPTKKERHMGCEDLPKGNTHPTLKPIKLMEYLTKLVTRPNGIVLDPFMGSGTTGVACKNNGFDFIGIEQEKEYYDIAQRRIAYEKGNE